MSWLPLRARRRSRVPLLAAFLTLLLGGCSADDPVVAPPPPPPPVEPAGTLDQENLLDGWIVGQGIGRFSVRDGSGDPDGAEWDLQDAQLVTAGRTGVLSAIRVPVRNTLGGTQPVTLQLRLLQDGERPEPDDDLVLGAASVPASACADVKYWRPETWATFDVSGLGLRVVAGQAFCFSLSTTDTIGFLVNPERSNGYAAGRAFRRNRAATAEWSAQPGADLGFQTFVVEAGR